MSDYIYNLVEFVDLKERDLVSGFIREANQLLKENPLNRIPDIVYAHCLWYYFHLQKAHADDGTWTGVQCTHGYDQKRAQSYHYMRLNKKLLRGIFEYGFDEPSIFHQYTIPLIIDKHDIVAESIQTVDHWAAFVIGILQQLDLNEPQCQAVIMSPSREAARLQQKLVESIGKNLNVSCHGCYGGTAIRTDINVLSNGIQIVCGTPGRIRDMIQRNVLKLDKLRIVLLNEMNEILKRGLGEQIYDIFECISTKIQIMVFTSTLCTQISQFENIFMNKSVHISSNDLSLEFVRQYYVAVEIEDYKLATLCDLYECMTITQCVIYCNTRRKMQWLKDKCVDCDFTVCTLHEEMKHNEKECIIRDFATGSYRLLISTDLKTSWNPFVNLKVSLVINYDLPKYKEQWIYRNGRKPCRFGRRRGICICFVCDDEEETLRDIENYYNTQIEELPLRVDDIFDRL